MACIHFYGSQHDHTLTQLASTTSSSCAHGTPWRQPLLLRSNAPGVLEPGDTGPGLDTARGRNIWKHRRMQQDMPRVPLSAQPFCSFCLKKTCALASSLSLFERQVPSKTMVVLHLTKVQPERHLRVTMPKPTVNQW